MNNPHAGRRNLANDFVADSLVVDLPGITNYEASCNKSCDRPRVAATGRYEQSSFDAFVDEGSARANYANDLNTLAQERGDRLDKLKIEKTSLMGTASTSIVLTAIFEGEDEDSYSE